MQLLDWLDSLLALQAHPQDLLADAIESAVDCLRHRALNYQADPLGSGPYREALWEMSECLLDITDDLEDFLVEENFRLVQAARLRALKMIDLEKGLYQSDLAEDGPLA